MSKKFCVDNRSDPESVAKAVRALKRTVAFGKRAEEALKQLEERGHYNFPVPVFTRLGYGNAVYNADVHKFPAYVPISRDSIPGWDDISIECGPIQEGSHGGAKFRQVPVFLRATALVAENDGRVNTGKIIHKTQRLNINSARLGDSRMKSNGTVTFSPGSHFRGNHSVFRIKRNTEASDKTRGEALQFASIMSHSLIQFEGGYGYDHRSIPQQLLDLREVVPKWLVEDGIIHRLFGEVLDAIEIVKVMDA